MKNTASYVAVDIGGTHARVAGFSSLSDVVFENSVAFELSHVFENDFSRIIEAIDAIPRQEFAAIGVGVPGVLNEQKTGIIFANNIPEWIGMNIKNKLPERFGCAVYLDNDGVTSALGEALYGGSSEEDFIFIIWGTGVGGAAVEIKPELTARKLQKEDYPEELRQSLYGKALLEKYGKPLGELESKDWDSVTSDMEKLLVYVSDKCMIKNIVIGGGIALKQKERIALLSKSVKEHYNINLRATNLGDNHTFGLYGAAALIAQQEKNNN